MSPPILPAASPARSPTEDRGAAAEDRGDGVLFPPCTPFDRGWLDVGEGHCLFYEQCGTPGGPPVVFLHGGPGSGCSPRHRQLLNPAWRMVLFDQRGCGRSTPRGECRANTTADLVADIERLRTHLGIERWLVFGGSWGASLALAYCAQHRFTCTGAILRGIFLTGQRDIDWFFKGAGDLLPDHWSRLAAIAPPDRRVALAQWYFDTVGGHDDQLAIEAVHRWMDWEEALSHPGATPSPARAVDLDAARTQLPKYRLQAHYLRHECFVGETRMLEFARSLAGIPVAILHGRLDLVCRPSNAWAVHHVLPGSRLQLIDGAGHSPFDAAMARALAAAGNHFLAHRNFEDWAADR